jgi:hypothetical protein
MSLMCSGLLCAPSYGCLTRGEKIGGTAFSDSDIITYFTLQCLVILIVA